MFENLVVSDFLKRQLNRDADGDPYFFRTNDGLEVDLVRRTEDGLQPIEIKSATTWSKSLTNGLVKFMKLFPDAVRPTLLYGGRSLPAADGEVQACNFLEFS